MNPSQYTNLYQRLGVARTATPQEIRSAFRALAHTWHPDKRPNDPLAKQEFIAVSEAYEVLFDEQKRAAYDRTQTVNSFRARQEQARPREQYRPQPQPESRRRTEEEFKYYTHIFGNDLEDILKELNNFTNDKRDIKKFDKIYKSKNLEEYIIREINPTYNSEFKKKRR